MSSYFVYRIAVTLLWFQFVCSISLISKNFNLMDNIDSESEVANYLLSKSYIPKDSNLPKPADNTYGTDVTFLLSKLSDEQLLKLLIEQPKKSTFHLSDIVKLASGSKAVLEKKTLNSYEENLHEKHYDNEKNENKRFKAVGNDRDKAPGAYFKLDHKPVEPSKFKSDASSYHAAVQKLNSIIYNRPEVQEATGPGKSEEDERKKELLFDAVVGQLKTLCCKKGKIPDKHKDKSSHYKSLITDIAPQNTIYTKITNDNKPTEYMFLILNDEVKSANNSDELISVDPDSLDRNSSVLLLGPINTPLSDSQLKTVMGRISNELSRPEYLPLLQQMSEGTLTGNKVSLLKSLVTGPETRRYIKPHRCNHQSPLAKVYHGPKWLICTGYLNLNTPSLYD